MRILGFKVASKITFFRTKTTFWQTKRSTFEFTTVNKYLFAVTLQEKSSGERNDVMFFDVIRHRDIYPLEVHDINCSSFHNL